MQTIGTRMTAAREAAKLNRAEVARRTGIAAETLARYEGDAIMPGADKVARIAKAIGCTTDAILADSQVEGPNEDPSNTQAVA